MGFALERWSAVAVITALAGAAVVGCGTANSAPAGGNGSNTTSNSTANSAGGAGHTGASSTANGTAFVAYAASLQLANDQFVGPAFTKATGTPYKGQGGAAFAVANLILSKEITPNVFMSVGTAPIAVITPQFTTWAVGFASSPIVIAYSPQSPYASQLKAIANGSKPLSSLFTLMEQPKFHLGRTNPNTDPQGQAFIFMMRLAESQLHLPQGTANWVLGSVNNPKQIFAESSILSRLQAGQLDATSAYLPEAIQRHLPYISLPNTINLGDPSQASLYATQQMTISGGKKVKGSPIEVYATALARAPDATAGAAFVKYILSPAGKALYKKEGYTLTKPILYGNQKDIPQSVQQDITQAGS